MAIASVSRLALKYAKVERLILRNSSVLFNNSSDGSSHSLLAKCNTKSYNLHTELVSWKFHQNCRHFSRVEMLQSIAQSTPVMYVHDSLIYLHDWSHLPWWSVIVLTTVGVRFLITFPFTVYQSVILARYANLQPEIKQLAGQLRAETARAVKMFNWDEKTAKRAFFKSLHKHRQTLIVRENCHPFKASVVIWIQIPVWIAISFALRNIVYGGATKDGFINYLSMATEGTLWFSNLTLPDPLFVLPVLLGAINLTIVEFHALKATNPGKLQKTITWVFRGLSVVMIPIAATVPSCLALYWVTSSCVGLLHNVLLVSPKVRKLCGIPSVKGDSLTPYSDIWDKLKSRSNKSSEK
ncbi:hypothetical protein CHUAL_000345 [Chamberlinius hualienensis]